MHGPADVFDPQESFWGGGFKTPSGLVYSPKEAFASSPSHRQSQLTLKAMKCQVEGTGQYTEVGQCLWKELMASLCRIVCLIQLEAMLFSSVTMSEMLLSRLMNLNTQETVPIATVGSVDLIDGTNGNQPRGTKIVGNLVHEIGIYGKQISAYIQSLACQTEITGTIFFNGPCTGINFNDGFGGGNIVKNILSSIWFEKRVTMDPLIHGTGSLTSLKSKMATHHQCCQKCGFCTNIRIFKHVI